MRRQDRGAAAGGGRMTGGVRVGEPFAEYAAADGLSCSTLKRFRKSSLDGACAMVGPQDETHQMRLGRALHERMELGPERFSEASVTVKGLKPAAYPATFAKADAEHPGKIVLAETWDERIRGMAASILSHPIAGKLTAAKGETEVSVYWGDPDLGVRCKARLDRVLPGIGIVDYKTTSALDIRGMERSIYDYAYHMQAAWYMRAANMVFHKMSRPSFLFVFAESVAPFDVVVVDLDEDAIAAGWAECCLSVSRWKEWQSGAIKGISGRVVTLGLPAWARVSGWHAPYEHMPKGAE